MFNTYKTVRMIGAMQRVRQTVSLVLNLPQHGGRLITRDECTLILMDYDYLPHAAIQQICDQHPHLVIDTHQSEHSSSGYVVMFTLPQRKNLFAQSVCCQLCLTVAFVLVVTTLPMFDCWQILT